MIGAILGALGGMAGGAAAGIGGIGSMIGGAAGGVGGMLGGAGMYGSAAVGGQAATTGLLGAGGQFGLTQAAGTLGMGMSLAQAFGGGSVSGYAPTEKVKLTERGEKLEKKTFETIKKQREEGLMPPNLASIYIGQIKAQEGGRARMARGMLSSAATQRVRTGGGMLGAVSAAQSQMAGLVAPTERRVELEEEEFRNALANLQNIMNIEKQAPILHAESQFARSGLQQLRSAAQGEAIGQMLNYLGYINRAR